MRTRGHRWVKLYQREEGSFALLSITARAVAALLLKHVDHIGCIDVGGRSLIDALAIRMGATGIPDRRLLKSAIPELLKDGYIVATATGIRVRNYCTIQGNDPSREVVATESRGSCEVDVKSPRPSCEIPPKTVESLKSAPVVEISRDKKRREKILPASPDPNFQPMKLAFVSAWEKAYGDEKYPWSKGDGPNLSKLIREHPDATEKWTAATLRFLADPFWQRLRNPLASLCSKWGMFCGPQLASARGSPPSDKTRSQQIFETNRAWANGET